MDELGSKNYRILQPLGSLFMIKTFVNLNSFSGQSSQFAECLTILTVFIKIFPACTIKKILQKSEESKNDEVKSHSVNDFRTKDTSASTSLKIQSKLPTPTLRRIRWFLRFCDSLFY